MKLKRIICALTAAVMIAAVAAGCKANQEKAPAAIDVSDIKLTDSEISEISIDIDTLLRDNNYMGQTFVGFNGQTVFNDARGFATEEKKKQLSPTDKLRIGHSTKSITGTAIQLLAERGQLKLDDTLDKFFISSNKRTYLSKITIEDLLDNSVLFGSYSYNVFSKSNTYSMVKLRLSQNKDTIKTYIIDAVLDSGTIGKTSSDSNYFLLGSIIETVTGESYRRFVKKNIFNKLGMKNTGFVGENYTTEGIYAPDSVWENQNFKPEYNDYEFCFSTMSVVSTAEDMARFYSALLSGELLKENILLKVRSSPRNAKYGFTLKGNSLSVIGITPTSTSSIRINPERNEVAVTLSNNSKSKNLEERASSIYNVINSKVNGKLLG